MFRSKVVIFALIVIAQLDVAAASVIKIKNSYGEPMYVWFWPKVEEQWIRPAMFLPRRQSREFRVTNEGRHYIVLKDLAQREEHIGWYDLRELAATLASTELVLHKIEKVRTGTRKVAKPVWKDVEQTYTVSVPHVETRTRTITRIDPRTGRRYQVEQTYNVTVWRQETRTRTVKVKEYVTEEQPYEYIATVPALKVRVGNEMQLLEEFLER